VPSSASKLANNVVGRSAYEALKVSEQKGEWNGIAWIWSTATPNISNSHPEPKYWKK